MISQKKVCYPPKKEPQLSTSRNPEYSSYRPNVVTKENPSSSIDKQIKSKKVSIQLLPPKKFTKANVQYAQQCNSNNARQEAFKKNCTK